MGLAAYKTSLGDEEIDAMAEAASEASSFLKAFSHEGRLMILCYLTSGEKSVTEIEDFLGARQPAVSQQLSRLRLEGLIKPRRDGKVIYYSLADDRPRRLMELMHAIFCRGE